MMSMCNPQTGICVETDADDVMLMRFEQINQVFANEEKVLESYIVLSEAVSLSEEEEAEDGRDDCLGQSKEKEG